MSFVPVGAVLPFYGGNSQLPSGYLFCDGATISKTSYPQLYAHLTFANPALGIDHERVNLPDLRGEFLRGWDNDRQVDPSRKLGSLQHDTLKEHKHNMLLNGHNDWPNSGDNKATSVVSAQGELDRISGSINGSEAGGFETRPRNIAINFVSVQPPPELMGES